MLSFETLAMNVDWLPNDENAPLPLSSSYRANLRKLCVLLGSGKQLHPDLLRKKKVLVKMCAKLERDDSNIAAGESEGRMKKMGLGAAAILGVGLLLANGDDLVYSAKKAWRRWFGRGRGYYVRGGATPDDEGQILASLFSKTLGGGEGNAAAAEANIRELQRKARLARFGEGASE